MIISFMLIIDFFYKIDNYIKTQNWFQKFLAEEKCLILSTTKTNFRKEMSLVFIVHKIPFHY